jgi:DTW domain-containing protein YfiP
MGHEGRDDEGGIAPFKSRTVAPRCGSCALPVGACLCGEARRMKTRTKVVVLVHRREVHKTTGTARLVPLTLARGELRTVGLPEDRVHYEGLEEEGRSTLLLSPVAGAVELTRELVGDRPTTLVVPDGNWRQARRMATNEAPLARLVAVRLPEGPTRRFELRKHPQAERLSTFEAIARALGILEGAEVQHELERILHLKVERTLDTRGRRKDGDRA